MKNASELCLATLQKRSRQFKSKLVFDDFELTKAEKLTFTHTSSTSAGLTFGTCAIGTGSFSIKKDEHDLDGKEFTAYIGVVVSGGTEWINMGRYKITNVDVEGIVKNVTFEDYISRLDVPFKIELEYPVSANEVIGHIVKLCDIEIQSNIIDIQITQDLYGTSCRNIIKMIAQMLGKFATIDSEYYRFVDFKWYTDNGISISSANNNLYQIDEPTFDKDFTLGTISNYTGTETITSGDENSTGVISIANPMITQDTLDSLYEEYKGFSYAGAEVDFKLGNPLIDAWDIITVEYKGKTARIPCMSVEHTFDGGFTTKIKSFVRNENTAFEGELTQTMNEVKTQITIVDGKVESKVSKDDVISSINQSPEEIKIQAERITLSGETTFEDVSNTVDTVNSWRGQTDTTTINGAKIETGSVTAEQIDVDTIFANKIISKENENVYIDLPNADISAKQLKAPIGDTKLTITPDLTTGGTTPVTIQHGDNINFSFYAGETPSFKMKTDRGNIISASFGEDSQAVGNDFFGIDMSNEEYSGNENFQSIGVIANYDGIDINMSDYSGPTATNGSTFLLRKTGIMHFGDNDNNSVNYYDNVLSLYNTKEDTTQFYETGIRFKRSVTGASIMFGIGGSGTQRGIYDDTLDKWVFLVNADGAVYVHGNADGLSMPRYNGSPTTLACKLLYKGDGFFCNGNTTADNENSVELSDTDHVYKRLTLYFVAPYGLGCADFPLDNTNASVATWGDRVGGHEFPAGDNTDGAIKGISYRFQWRVVQTTTGWTVQMTESGWYNKFNGMNYTADAWSSNSTKAVSGSAYPAYNPRHNSGYLIYKIVGWTE